MPAPRPSLFIEAAVESIGSVLAAHAEGVDRIELCGSQLRQLVAQARDRIDILAGGAITPANVVELIERSGVWQVHGKAFAGLRAAIDPADPAR